MVLCVCFRCCSGSDLLADASVSSQAFEWCSEDSKASCRYSSEPAASRRTINLCCLSYNDTRQVACRQGLHIDTGALALQISHFQRVLNRLSQPVMLDSIERKCREYFATTVKGCRSHMGPNFADTLAPSPPRERSQACCAQETF